MRYRWDRISPWVARSPRFGVLGIAAAATYIGFGLHFDSVDNSLPVTSVSEADLADAFDTAWAYRGLVVFVVVAYVVLRIVRAMGRSQGFTGVGWRAFAATSAVETFALAFLPGLAAVVAGYGVGLLETNDRITQEVFIGAIVATIVMSILSIVGLVYAVVAVVNFFRALIGTVAR
jgi:hypothetical protein